MTNLISASKARSHTSAIIAKKKQENIDNRLSEISGLIYTAAMRGENTITIQGIEDAVWAKLERSGYVVLAKPDEKYVIKW